MSPVLIVLLILVVGGAAAFFVWKYVLDKSNEPQASAAGPRAPAVAPEAVTTPAPVEPPRRPTVTSKIELATGKPRTILAFFAGTIEWIEATDKDVKSGDVVMKLGGYKQLEQQVNALKPEVEKRNTELQTLQKARDTAEAGGNAAALKAADAKLEAAKKIYNEKNDLLIKKTDQLEPLLVRLINDGKLTVTKKVGDKITENTPIATLVLAPEPSATFKIPKETKQEIGVAAAVKIGDKLVTCIVSDWEPESIRMTCPSEPGVVEGAAVSWQIP